MKGLVQKSPKDKKHPMTPSLATQISIRGNQIPLAHQRYAAGNLWNSFRWSTNAAEEMQPEHGTQRNDTREKWGYGQGTSKLSQEEIKLRGSRNGQLQTTLQLLLWTLCPKRALSLQQLSFCRYPCSTSRVHTLRRARERAQSPTGCSIKIQCNPN